MRQLSVSLLALVAAAGATVVATSSAHAQSARRASLAGSPLIEDDDDVYTFPQLAFGKELYLEGSFMPSSGLYGAAGSGGLMIGNETHAFGVLTHRADYNATLASTLMGPFEAGGIPGTFAGPFAPGGTVPAFRYGTLGFLGVPTPQHIPAERAADPDETANVGGTTIDLSGSVANAGPGPEAPEYTPDPVQLIDLVYARSNFGVRLSVGARRFSKETRITWGDGEVIGATAFNANLVGGMTMDLSGSKLDAAAELGFAHASTTTTNTGEGNLLSNDVSANMLPAIGLGIRMVSPQSDSLDYVTTANLHWESASKTTQTSDITYYWDNPNTDPVNPPDPVADAHEESKAGPVPMLLREESRSSSAMYAAFGPKFHIKNRATIAADIGIGFTRTAYDPWVATDCTDSKDYRDVCSSVVAAQSKQDVLLDADNDITWTWALPSVRVAGEFNVTKRIALRTGMRSVFWANFHNVEGNNATSPADVSDAESDPAPGADDYKETTTGQTYYWTAGMGVNFGEFTIDGTFDTSFVTDGPQFLSGRSGAMFGMVTLKYDLGKGASNDNVTGSREGYEAEEGEKSE